MTFPSRDDCPLLNWLLAGTVGRMLEQPGSRVLLQLAVEQVCHARGPGCSSILPIDLNVATTCF